MRLNYFWSKKAIIPFAKVKMVLMYTDGYNVHFGGDTESFLPFDNMKQLDNYKEWLKEQ